MAKKKAIIPLCADAPRHGLTLLPHGAFLNIEIDNIQPGDLLMLGRFWNRKKRVLIRKCKININTSVGNFVFKHIYGDNMRYDEVFDHWRSECVFEGLGNEAFSDNLWLLETVPYDADVEKMENELADIEARKKELSRMLEDARKGIFNHPDII